MTQEQFDKVLPFYWVAVFKLSEPSKRDTPYSFRFSLLIPESVPNTRMYWDKPTYEELVEYNKSFLKT